MTTDTHQRERLIADLRRAHGEMLNRLELSCFRDGLHRMAGGARYADLRACNRQRLALDRIIDSLVRATSA